MTLVESQKQQEQESVPWIWSLDFRNAIAAKFLEMPGRLDIRYLWTHGSKGYFRVNWWKTRESGEQYIYKSAFVAVEEADYGPVVTEATFREAA